MCWFAAECGPRRCNVRRIFLGPILLLLFCPAVQGATYYVSPAGSDANSGMDATHSWASPNHALNCGDTILAAAGNYNAYNFTTGKWGKVNCPAANNVAWLKCATFDSCKISSNATSGMWIDNNNWGVQGWEITTTGGGYSAGITVAPNYTTPVNIHRIIVANNVIDGAMAGGITQSNRGSASVDYVAFVGNVVYHSSQSGSLCYSGFGFYEPLNSDNLPGTHLYVDQWFTWANVEPSPCAGYVNGWDGNGLSLDSINGRQTGLSPSYSGQIVVRNGISVFNGNSGIVNSGSGNTRAPIYIHNNTLANNGRDINSANNPCGDLTLSFAPYVQAYSNLIQTSAPPGCSHPEYAVRIDNSTASTLVYDNWLYSAAGLNIAAFNNSEFTAGPNNITAESPQLRNPVMPPAPNCAGKANVIDCMSGVIASFASLSGAATGYGYQVPSTAATQTPDPLFPQWLCNVNLPSGLITMHCTAH